MNIAVAGAGYVGMSLAVLLAARNTVYLVDVDQAKIDAVREGKSPIADADIDRFLTDGNLDLRPTLDAEGAYAACDLVVVAVPTDYDPERDFFDTSLVERVVDLARAANPDAVVAIKSTVPVGYTDSLSARCPQGRFLFSPEFLREGKALYDNLHPSRIVVGVPKCGDSALREWANRFAALLAEGAEDEQVPVLVMGASEAESVKLFSNTYLALRVAYFNELDTYADLRGLDVAQIVEGVCLDPRIGEHYNNPSFGYGGYCLPKDTKQLLANYRDVPQSLISAIVEANRVRKDHVAESVAARLSEATAASDGSDAPLVGIYRLTMKTGSDNIRASSVLGVMKRLAKRGVPMLVYAPLLDEDAIMGSEITHDLDSFKRRSTVIVANRMSSELNDVADKVYTRDLFGRD